MVITGDPETVGGIGGDGDGAAGTGKKVVRGVFIGGGTRGDGDHVGWVEEFMVPACVLERAAARAEPPLAGESARSPVAGKGIELVASFDPVGDAVTGRIGVWGEAGWVVGRLEGIFCDPSGGKIATSARFGGVVGAAKEG